MVVMFVKLYVFYVVGLGILEIKCIIVGFVMKGFFGFWIFFIKFIVLFFVIGFGFLVGKEGFSVYYVVCMGNVILRMFIKYR